MPRVLVIKSPILGFYSYYRQAFELIKIAEEKAFTNRTQDSDEEYVEEYEKLPGFGISTTDIEQVLRFYSKWENFTTYKSFSWADKYNPSEVPICPKCLGP
jgi:DnaJ family protein A protein 5